MQSGGNINLSYHTQDLHLNAVLYKMLILIVISMLQTLEVKAVWVLL